MKNDFKIVAYYAAWNPDEFSKVRYDKLTHINYAFAIPTEDGDIRPLENEDTAKRLIKEGHENGVKVIISVGGWSYLDIPLEETFIKATESPEKIEKLTDSIVKMVQEYDFDGADIDWEHPREKRGTCKQYEDFVCVLSKKIHAIGKLLTCAVLGGKDAAGKDEEIDANGNSVADASRGHTAKALAEFDIVNIMCYDGGDGEIHSPYYFAEWCGAYWRDERGVPAEKLTLGVPFYGRPGGPYWRLLEANPEAANNDTIEVNGRTAHYNGIPTIRKKTRYAKENLGGIMIWEISEDTTDEKNSLLCAIYDEANK